MTDVLRASPMVCSYDGKTQDRYWVLGNREKPPLLFIPGFTGTHSDLLEVTEFLEKDFRIYIAELPGWGESPRITKRLTIHNYALYLKALVDFIKIKDITLVGHCMGATVAIELAYLYPDVVKKVILISTPYRKGLLSQKLFVHLADLSEHAPKRFKPLFFLWRSRIVAIPTGVITLKFRSYKKKFRSLRHLFTYQPTEPEDSVEENWTSLMHYHYSKIKHIHAPIHFIHGEKDMLVSVNQAVKLYDMVKGATIDFIPDAGHIPPSETPESLATLILKYKNN